MKKFFKIFGLVLLLALVIGVFVYLWEKQRPEKQAVETVMSKKADVRVTTLATGKITPRDEVKIKPQISGVIVELYKEAGDFVQKDEVICKLNVIADMSSLASAQSQLRQAQIALDKAQVDYNRQKGLYDKGVISADAFEQYEVDLKKAQSDKQYAEDYLSVVRDGVMQSLKSQSTTYVRSTASGTILDLPEKVGNSVVLTNSFNEGTTIATVADMTDLLFDGTIDETEVGKLKVGMPCKVTIGALQRHSFDAELEYIAPMGTDENGAVSFEIKAKVVVPDSIRLRAGYSANAEIIVGERNDVITVPEAALRFAGDTTYVEVVVSKAKEIFERRDVMTGLSDGINIEIKNGLTENVEIKK